MITTEQQAIIDKQVADATQATPEHRTQYISRLSPFVPDSSRYGTRPRIGGILATPEMVRAICKSIAAVDGKRLPWEAE